MIPAASLSSKKFHRFCRASVPAANRHRAIEADLQLHSFGNCRSNENRVKRSYPALNRHQLFPSQIENLKRPKLSVPFKGVTAWPLGSRGHGLGKYHRLIVAPQLCGGGGPTPAFGFRASVLAQAFPFFGIRKQTLCGRQSTCFVRGVK